MMPSNRCSEIGFPIVLLILIISLFSAPAQAAVLYKSYVVRKAGAQEILCDPYIVQKDDYVLKIFRQRGEISKADFPDFLNIFKVINPQIQNVDRILPGQHIFIPLKKLDSGSIPDQDSGVVTIPFVTGTEIENILKKNSEVHQVRPGDTVSKLLSVNFGGYGTKAYKEGVNIFKAMNPDVRNINFLAVGQEVWVPQKALRNQPWYESLFDASGNVAGSGPGDADSVSPKTATGEEAEDAGKGTGNMAMQTSIEQAAQILDAKLYQKGTYYFPRPGLNDLRLELTKFPMLEVKGGAHVLLTPLEDPEMGLSEAELTVFRSFWKDLVVAKLPQDPSLSQILDSVIACLGGRTNPDKRILMDGGIRVTLQPRWMIDQLKREKILAVTAIETPQERTPQPVLDYLEKFGIVLKEVSLKNSADKLPDAPVAKVSYSQVPVLDAASSRKTFVQNFWGILGAAYSQNVKVSFPYAGIQIEVLSNILSRPDGFSVLVDFGDLQGDAVSAIGKTGLKVLQVFPGTGMKRLVPELVEAAGMTCETDPVFMAADRPGPDNTTIMVPGFLVRRDNQSRVLLATVPVNDKLIRFFHEKNIDVAALMNMIGS